MIHYYFHQRLNCDVVLRQIIFHLGLCVAMRTAAQDQSKWKDMILKVPSLDEQGVIRINRQLACFVDLHFSGYVKNENCILLKYDPKKIIDPDIIETTICFLNNRLSITEIEGLTMYEIIDGKLPK